MTLLLLNHQRWKNPNRAKVPIVFSVVVAASLVLDDKQRLHIICRSSCDVLQLSLVVWGSSDRLHLLLSCAHGGPIKLCVSQNPEIMQRRSAPLSQISHGKWASFEFSCWNQQLRSYSVTRVRQFALQWAALAIHHAAQLKKWVWSWSGISDT